MLRHGKKRWRQTKIRRMKRGNAFKSPGEKFQSLELIMLTNLKTSNEKGH